LASRLILTRSVNAIEHLQRERSKFSMLPDF
jgi:hypothetical protein